MTLPSAGGRFSLDRHRLLSDSALIVGALALCTVAALILEGTLGIARTLVGPATPYHYLIQVSTALLLVLAANTAFADFAEFVPRHFWEYPLHNQTALRLKVWLFFRPNTVVTDVPYHLNGAVRGAEKPARS